MHTHTHTISRLRFIIQACRFGVKFKDLNVWDPAIWTAAYPAFSVGTESHCCECGCACVCAYSPVCTRTSRPGVSMTLGCYLNYRHGFSQEKASDRHFLIYWRHSGAAVFFLSWEFSWKCTSSPTQLLSTHFHFLDGQEHPLVGWSCHPNNVFVFMLSVAFLIQMP